MFVEEGDNAQVAVVQPASGGFPRHSHDEYVISVNLCGRERVVLDRSSFEVGTDEVTVYNPGQVQSCTTQVPAGTAWGCVSWYVPPAAVAALTGGELVDFDRPVVRAARLRTELLDVAQAVRAGSPDRELIKERLSLLLMRLFDLGGRTRPEPPRPADARIRAVVDRLREDLSNAPRLADLAQDAGMSREHLIRSFTRATGCPPYTWHLQARLAEGRRRLRQGQAVADVAHGLGFADQAHFHRHFTAAYAITPGRYRRGVVNI
ncbi:AraC family transcriptional regulator [Actinomadura fulvescens]|uniref:AraC family transcriptional regulator n=2 Tax=Actinomadura fulvescens TaxID=46160 RepID=A0ABN3PG13_9ACTN